MWGFVLVLILCSMYTNIHRHWPIGPLQSALTVSRTLTSACQELGRRHRRRLPEGTPVCLGNRMLLQPSSLLAMLHKCCDECSAGFCSLSVALQSNVTFAHTFLRYLSESTVFCFMGRVTLTVIGCRNLPKVTILS